MQQTIRQRGGIRIGDGGFALNLSWPFASIAATETGVIVEAPSRVYFLNKPDITGLRKYNAVIATGLQIVHTKEGYPHHIVFWPLPFRFGKLKSQLQQLGYTFLDE